jgi:hypothetical protein
MFRAWAWFCRFLRRRAALAGVGFAAAIFGDGDGDGLSVDIESDVE